VGSQRFPNGGESNSRARELPAGTDDREPQVVGYEGAPDDWLVYDQPDGYASFDDTDTAAEVIAVWRIQRRVAVSYMVVFLIGILGIGLAIGTLPWVTETTVVNGFSPGFVLAAFGLYAFFLVIGVGAASLANSVEHRMMGASSVESRPSRSDRYG